MKMIHPELIIWNKCYGSDLTLGTVVVIDESCEYFEPDYDTGMKFMVTGLCVDSGGLNISLSDQVPISKEMHDRYIQETDGYRIKDLRPFKE